MVRPKCLQTSLKWDAFRSHVETKCLSAENKVLIIQELMYTSFYIFENFL